MSLLRRSDPNLPALRVTPRAEPLPANAAAKNAAKPALGDEFAGGSEAAAGASLQAAATPNLAIRDLKTVSTSLRFDDRANISSLKLNLDLEHSYRGDLVVTLTSPSGKSATISDRAGGSADHLKGTFDLAQFQGEPLQGEWTLTVQDKARRDTGTLKSWSLDAVVQKPAPAANTVKISSFDDDPMVQASHVEQLAKTDFQLGNDGKPTGLVGPNVKMTEAPSIGQMNSIGTIKPFATNPWSLPAPGEDGSFLFEGEERFPTHSVELGADGKPKVNAEGLQVWTPRGDHLAQATAFEAANTVLRHAEQWGGRDIRWGNEGQLEIEAHSFIGLNANYNPLDRKLRFGVVPYKTAEGELKMFEMASSWEVVAHEAGHALQDALKPHKGLVDLGYRQWGESFGDQLSMWSSVQDPERAAALLEETGGDFSKSNALSRIAEAYGTLSGNPDSALRDAVNDLKVSTTSTQFHERSQVLTGAAYEIFQGVFSSMKAEGKEPAEALRDAGDVMGTFLLRSTEHTPENAITLEDVAHAYLKVDKEYFGGKYGKAVETALRARELLNDASMKEFAAHEARIPKLTLQDSSKAGIERLLASAGEKLNLGGGFNARLTSFHNDELGQTVVRFQLERGGAVVNNHAVMVFRADGSLMDYQNPMPASLDPADAAALLDRAHQLGIDRHGPVTLVQKDDGSFTAQVVREHARGSDPHLEVFSVDQPRGQRAEYAHVERIREHLTPPDAPPAGAHLH